MLTLNNLTIQTRHPIVQGVTKEFINGNVYGFVAVNGSGKTTLFRTIVGLLKPKSGSITLNDKPVYQQLNKIYYFESHEWLDPNLSGLDYLNFVKNMWKSSVEIQALLQYWDMASYASLPIRKYSLGMKQRLLICMYLVSDADVLIMDEITNGLDESNRQKLFQQIQTQKLQGKTILLSSHYKDEIVLVCDKLFTIEKEQLVEVSL